MSISSNLNNELALVWPLVGLGKALALDVVAEGVESLEEAAALPRLGCLFGQGYLWSRAVPPERFLQLLVTSDAAASSSVLISGG